MTLGEVPVVVEKNREPLPRVVGRVETDMFCGGCHYNLHGLDVLCDPRLDLAVVRCPECGKYQAAGISTGAGRVWLTRLSTFLVALWVGWMFLGIVIMGIAMMIVDAGQMEAFSHYSWDQAGPTVISLATPETTEQARSQALLQGFFFCISALAGFLLGTGGAVCLSHLKRGWLLFLGIVPLLVIAAIYILSADERRDYSREYATWVAVRHAFEVMIQWGGIAVGILLGRSFARGVLRAALSRKLLQYVRFLWEVDGLPPPGMTVEGAKT